MSQLENTQKKVDDGRSEQIANCLLRLAYRNSAANILVNVAAGLGLALILEGFGADPMTVRLWCLLLLLVTAARLAGVSYFNHAYRNLATIQPDEQRRWTALYAAGLMAALLLWVYMTGYALSVPHPEAQFSALIVVAALAAGATGILSPLVVLGQGYVAIMLFQAAIQLSLLPEPKFLLAGLALVFAVVMIVSIRNNHAVLRKSLSFQFQNDALVSQLEDERRSLEGRVSDRTAELKHQAEHDLLTNLLNREGLFHWLEDSQRRFRPDDQLATIFIDLDRFKQINDGMGHAVGDMVLVTLASRMRDMAPQGVALCRWGGDEFVLIVPLPHESAGAAVDEILAGLKSAADQPLEISGTALHVGFSAGVSLRPAERFSLSAAVREADLAAAEVKRNGRGAACFFSSELAVTQERKLVVAQALKGAVERGEFSVAFQPIVNAANSTIDSYEALARWTSPTLGVIGPDEFIPIAEDTGEIAEIGNFVMDRAVSALGNALANSQQTKIAINVSLKQLIRPDFVTLVLDRLARSRVAPRRLVVEVTESIFESRNHETINTTLVALASAGVEIHLDDFGTGYSSLSRLHEMPITGLKIDKSFIRRLDKHAIAIIEGSVLIARKLGIATIAEGVETREQAAALRLMGIALFQGYLFGRPALEFLSDTPQATVDGSAEDSSMVLDKVRLVRQ